MWKVKSLKVYRSDGKYLAFIKAANGEITKVKVNLPFLFLNLVKVFRKSYENMQSMPMPNQEINIEQMDEAVDTVITLWIISLHHGATLAVSGFIKYIVFSWDLLEWLKYHDCMFFGNTISIQRNTLYEFSMLETNQFQTIWKRWNLRWESSNNSKVTKM